MVNINLIQSIKNISRLAKLYIYNSHNIKNYKFIEKNLNQKL